MPGLHTYNRLVFKIFSSLIRILSLLMLNYQKYIFANSLDMILFKAIDKYFVLLYVQLSDSAKNVIGHTSLVSIYNS